MECINAVAVFDKNFINGSIMFHQCEPKRGTYILYKLNGPPNRKFAVHIHEFGDARQGCDSLGAHWNPFHKKHGSFLINKVQRHAGDIAPNNIMFNENGVFEYEYYDPLISLIDSFSIVGRSVVIHAGIDDLGLGQNEGSLETGNSGERIAYAIIGRAQ